MNDAELFAAARGAAENSYSPYSRFRVGAVVVSDDGQVFTGANVENAAYPATSCGEATAINSAVASGVRNIESVTVACIDATDTDGAYPCGRCRQIMSEFDVKRVLVTGGEGTEERVHTLDELLPHRFNL